MSANQSSPNPPATRQSANWLKRVVLRVMIFAALAEYRSLLRAKMRTGHNIGVAVIKDSEAADRLKTCRAILHIWQRRLHAPQNDRGERP